MLLSNQQKYIIAVLRQIKYIRSDQLRALTAQHYRPQGIEISQHRMDVACYGERTVDPRYLEAIDVMLELSGCAPAFFSPERLKEPFLLRFAGSGDDLSYLFTVAWMDTPARIAATPRMKGERIIWISERPNGYDLALPRHHIFAVRQEDGSHRFFGSQEPKKI